MEQGNLSFMIAFFAGVVSFFSPCHLPLVPVYLGFLAGSIAGADGIPQKYRVLFNSLNFVVGFSAVFLLLGVLASWFAAFFTANQPLLQRLAGGLYFLACIWRGFCRCRFYCGKSACITGRRRQAPGQRLCWALPLPPAGRPVSGRC